MLGTQSNGQGHETSYPQIAAALLGLPLDSFRYVQADTRLVREGAGHGGARSMHLGGGALFKAAEAVIAKGQAIAAGLLQADGAEIVFSEGHFTVGGTERTIDLISVARAAADPANLPEGMAPGLDSHVFNRCDLVTFPNGCHLAEVEIDPETGAVTLERYAAVDDYGRLVNPLLTKGQVQGGVAQGIGQALLEHTVYDAQSGQLASGSLLDYALPRADDLPWLEITLNELPTTANPLGVKGSGQAGAIAAPQTIVNAILDALAPARRRTSRHARHPGEGLAHDPRRSSDAGGPRQREIRFSVALRRLNLFPYASFRTSPQGRPCGRWSAFTSSSGS